MRHQQPTGNKAKEIDNNIAGVSTENAESSDCDSDSNMFSSQSQPMFSSQSQTPSTALQPLLNSKCQTPMTEREKELDDQFEV